SVGKSVVLPESFFDAVTAVSGSGPAYVFYLAEGLIQAAGGLNLPREAAEILIRQTVAGAAAILESGEDPAELRRKVTSPGGTTEAAIRHLESQKWLENFIQAVQKANDRASELRKQI